MRNSGQMVSHLLNVPPRFLRSAQLEKDFTDPKALDNYVVTPAMAAALLRVVDGLRRESNRRAWRVTGDYGVGKSSFALVLAHLLAQDASEGIARIAGSIGLDDVQPDIAPLWPILVTGSREGLVEAIARGVRESLEQQRPARSAGWGTIDGAIEACLATGTSRSLETLLEAVRAKASKAGRGMVLIIDELGKILEFAAHNHDRQDVFALQRLAEMAARSGDRPFVLLGILHQGFQAYAERLPAAVRHEWDKVAGRFEEIVFDQPLAHTAALIAGALGISESPLPTTVTREAKRAASATASMGWLGGETSGIASIDATRLYPLHPTLLPTLVRFFARFGQHERSLFGFLLSSEPFGLQSFAEKTSVGDGWYDLAAFYDYARASFGHRLSGASYQSHWLRIVATIEVATDIGALDARLMKAVGLLNLLDSDDLIANERTLGACFSAEDPNEIVASISRLKQRGLLFQRGDRGSLRLWPNSSVNLHATLENATRAVVEHSEVSAHIGQYLEKMPILARRHYLETGTMRYFEVRHIRGEALAEAIRKEPAGDGYVLFVMVDTEAEREAAWEVIEAQVEIIPSTILIGLLQPLSVLSHELAEVQRWRWIEDNTPELAHDGFAAAEVSRQLHNAKRSLAERFKTVSGVSTASGNSVNWWYAGKPRDMKGTVSNALSEICDLVFSSAPKVANELINRGALSSAAASARMRLIEGIFTSVDKNLLGIDPDRAPPEKSMYLSVLQAGRLHIERDGRMALEIPSPAEDPLKLHPALSKIITAIKSGRGHRVSVVSILDELRAAPFGVRDGLSPLLLALILKIHGHELAVYEDGTFLARFGANEFLRLSKAPASFDIQYCSVEGVRSEVFARLAEVFAKGVQVRRPVLLDVVQELCQFAAKLPDFTRKSRTLSSMSMAVRDALLSAREPATLLFKDLPIACELAPFDLDGDEVYSDAERFVINLSSAVNDLQGAYSQLLERIVLRVAEAAGTQDLVFDRAALASRASRVSLAAREPRLRAFALRLRDPGLSDEAWAEALASFVVARPPSRWLPGDEARFGEEIGALAELFAKVEAAAFSMGGDRPNSDAVRLNLTLPDGTDLVKVVQDVRLSDKDEVSLDALAGHLPRGDAKRIQFLANLLLRELKKGKQEPAQMAERLDGSLK
ncbi:ATP-binding protein [Mesorhizobium sp. M4A.F.Ca.ET.020.02.1.1]|uniref:ATP-binding protein n=1 Tax=unclassified Mesorhizobium TaxID=325217 RepID=UPI000FD5DAFB|nr:MULTISPECIES: ATP-binding protein [unclassified Mesorhizobium]RVD44119.1 ATP-binding protein [Mesorhizobium sp. M4A.F.Ca.ET.020.02.1.1]RWC13189.1 MAG: ATP-binding protein [Mesorhizobium sp.]